MRIKARLDDEGKQSLYKIQRLKKFTSIADTLNYCLKQTAENLAELQQDGHKMQAFLTSGYVGAFEGSETLSTDYKSTIKQDLTDKHYLM